MVSGYPIKVIEYLQRALKDLKAMATSTNFKISFRIRIIY